MMIIIIRTRWMKRKRENWSIKNNGEQNEDLVMEKRACYTIILNGCLCGERPSMAVISSTWLKDNVQALEYSTSLENKLDSQPDSEFGTSPTLTFKEVIWRIWGGGSVYNNAEYGPCTTIPIYHLNKDLMGIFPSVSEYGLKYKLYSYYKYTGNGYKDV